MRLILASSWAKMKSIEGKRVAVPFYEENGFLAMLQKEWKPAARVMIIAAFPDDCDVNDERLAFYIDTFKLSGLDCSEVILIDRRNMTEIRKLQEMDAVLLLGGHVPTQNAFLKELGVKERLQNYEGLVMAYSAGSMNCAETVYACPEIGGEAVNPEYERWIPGLGLTRLNILPHFQWLRDETVDGLRMVEDLAMPDSFRAPILALNDTAYVVCESGTETIYGDAWWIRDGVMTRVEKP